MKKIIVILIFLLLFLNTGNFASVKTTDTFKAITDVYGFSSTMQADQFYEISKDGFKIYGVKDATTTLVDPIKFEKYTANMSKDKKTISIVSKNSVGTTLTLKFSKTANSEITITETCTDQITGPYVAIFHNSLSAMQNDANGNKALLFNLKYFSSILKNRELVETYRLSISALEKQSLTFPDGSKYIGQVKNGKANGKGIQTTKKDLIYFGEFKDNLADGQGTVTFSKGDQFVGQFKNGKYCGQGTYTGANGFLYAGEWLNDKLNGQAMSIFTNGDRYVGQFKDNLLSGQGTITCANGDLYVGQWLEDKMHGQGTLTYKNDDGTTTTLSGVFNNGEFLHE